MAEFKLQELPLLECMVINIIIDVVIIITQRVLVIMGFPSAGHCSHC